MSITTEPLRNTTTLRAHNGLRSTSQRSTTQRSATRGRARAQRRATVARRTRLQAVAGVDRRVESCLDERESGGRMTWMQVVVASVGTALVLVGFVAVANLRAASLDAAPSPATAVVQQGETIGDVASRIAPNVPVQQTIDRMLELNGLGSAVVVPGQQLLAPSATGE